jgi:hypothetical protein
MGMGVVLRGMAEPTWWLSSRKAWFSGSRSPSAKAAPLRVEKGEGMGCLSGQVAPIFLVRLTRMSIFRSCGAGMARVPCPLVPKM